MTSHFLLLGNNPSAVQSQMQPLASTFPGKATWTLAFSLEEFDRYAKAEKDKLDFVILGPTTTAEQDASVRQIVTSIWGKVKQQRDEPGPGKWVLRIPGVLNTEAGRNGGIINWVDQQVEG
ncbi:hypothetical protein DACRYDRAFT_109646 [Dacryopinax primogenitus]|uniref:Uncharacterized protein n=1 Tax=Dacryopinax primogenitus (strain DJM 731) TaxID=1858805 RepID=M5G147_DACPD|nr:uncharacterized protein DACRYDRAFT_109646 [Dacryopinax primogenitus]EJT99546.1 hypothetical protein DACRYDRAFT_109646 [Dacryopinax primogenitus]